MAPPAWAPFLVALLFFPVRAQEAETQVPPPPRGEDVASAEGIVAALYQTISGPAGAQRDWNRLRSLFAPGARLIPVVADGSGPARLRVMEVEDYIRSARPYLEESGFFEREIARRVERFGHIVQVFSTYESRHRAEDAQPFARGINGIQLFSDGQRFWVVSILWDQEREGSPIPGRYLPEKEPGGQDR